LRAQRFEARQFSEGFDLCGIESLVVKNSDLHLDLFLGLEEFTQCFCDTGRIVTSNDNSSGTIQVFTDVRHFLGLSSDIEDGILYDVKLRFVLRKRGAQFRDFIYRDAIVIRKIDVVGFVEVRTDPLRRDIVFPVSF
jgi:hypothetical protein